MKSLVSWDMLQWRATPLVATPFSMDRLGGRPWHEGYDERPPDLYLVEVTVRNQPRPPWPVLQQTISRGMIEDSLPDALAYLTRVMTDTLLDQRGLWGRPLRV